MLNQNKFIIGKDRCNNLYRIHIWKCFSALSYVQIVAVPVDSWYDSINRLLTGISIDGGPIDEEVNLL